MSGQGNSQGLPCFMRVRRDAKGVALVRLSPRNRFSAFMTPSITPDSSLDARIQALGTEIFAEASTASVSLFNPEFYTGKLINWAMADDAFRVSLFRFVDVLPSLTTSEAVIQHVQEYFRPVAHRIPGLMKWGLDLDPKGLPAKGAALLVRDQIKRMAERFILGESPTKALKTLRKIRKDGLAFTVDILGEATVSEAESEAYLARYLELLDVLAAKLGDTKPLLAEHPGEATPVNISVKLSALYSQTKAVSFAASVTALYERLVVILRRAKTVGAFINVDMEDTKLTDLTIAVMQRVLLDPEFRDYDRIGMVFQAYLRRTEADLEAMLAFLSAHERRLTIRLVKGAYWDTETILAKSAEWPLPVWQEKAASDAAFERCAQLLFDHAPRVTPALGSHNIRSLCYAIAYAEVKGLTSRDYEIQALFGMAEPIKQAFRKRGYLVREYAPIGELIPRMGYLVRRLLENTSNKGFIRQGFHDDEDSAKLLAAPEITAPDTGKEYLTYDRETTFRNAPLWDFTEADKREAAKAAITEVRKAIEAGPLAVKPVLAGKMIEGRESVTMSLPEEHTVTLSAVHYATVEDAQSALEEADRFFSDLARYAGRGARRCPLARGGSDRRQARDVDGHDRARNRETLAGRRCGRGLGH